MENPEIRDNMVLVETNEETTLVPEWHAPIITRIEITTETMEGSGPFEDGFGQDIFPAV